MPCWTLPETLNLQITAVGVAVLLMGATSCLPKLTGFYILLVFKVSHVRENPFSELRARYIYKETGGLMNITKQMQSTTQHVVSWRDSPSWGACAMPACNLLITRRLTEVAACAKVLALCL